MRKYFLIFLATFPVAYVFAQSGIEGAPKFTVIKLNAAFPVKDQAKTGTCSSFSTTSLLESQALKNNACEIGAHKG